MVTVYKGPFRPVTADSLARKSAKAHYNKIAEIFKDFEGHRDSYGITTGGGLQ